MEPVTAEPFAYASPARRALAAFIDYFVVSFLASPFAGGASQRFAEAVFDGKTPDGGDFAQLTVATVLTIVVYSTAMHAWRGATFGKIAARTTLVNDDGSRVSPAAAFVRSVALAVIFFASTFALSVPLLLNALRPIWNRRRQTWHDSLARTIVVRADSLPAASPGRSEG
ncbi:MAG: RDD family protein [Acidimicrobiales bacterium]|nr:RDD family protein [Acidimicrobiales bacterium]